MTVAKPSEPGSIRLAIGMLPYWPSNRYLELAPKHWALTRAKLDPVELETAICSFTIPLA